MIALKTAGALGLSAAVLLASAVYPAKVSAQGGQIARASRVGSQAARHRHAQLLGANIMHSAEPPVSDYGRGFDGYDGRPDAGAKYSVTGAAVPEADGLDDPTEPGYGYGIGLPAYDFPLGSYGSPFDDASPYGGGSLDSASPSTTVGAMCTTPVRTCLLYRQSYVGIACSCKAPDGLTTGQVTP